MKRPVLRIFRALGLAYGTAILFVAGCQRSMIYFPDKLSVAAATNRAAEAGFVPWQTASGETIGWRKPRPNARNRLVVFHGNAGSALDRDFYVEGFQTLGDENTWEVYLFEYPGYGARSGSPGKDAFIAAGNAALTELAASDAGKPVFLLGESIGSGPACALAGQMPQQVSGIILVTPFARLAEVAEARFPWLPVRLLLRENFDNISALSAFRKPVVVVVAENDDVVGAPQGYQLHDALQTPKRLIVLKGATHNNFPIYSAEWFTESSAFVLEKHP